MESLTYADTVPYLPPIQTGKVIKVYDGDTITLGTILDNKAYRFSVRLRGIDCPEMRGPHQDQAKNARNELYNLVFHKMVTLQQIEYDKYGRILADVYIDSIHVNEWMIQKNLAVPYFGGKRSTE